MLFTRKIGKLVRGKATPFQVYCACILGALAGSLPGFSQAPALVLLWGLLLLVLNANLLLAGLVTLLAKLLFLLAMPALFHVGRLFLEGPTEGLFRALVNAPVTAYGGFDYYVVPSGQLLGLILGIGIGYYLNKLLRAYRVKMADLEQNSERIAKLRENKLTKAAVFIVLGSGRGKDSYEALLKRKVGNPIRIWGVAVVVIAVAFVYIASDWLASSMATGLVRSNLERINGATVDLESIALDLGGGKVEARGLALADREKLDTNLIQAETLVADVNTADLLRKRFSVDLLTVNGARMGAQRETPGERIGPDDEPAEPLALPDFGTLEDYLQNASVWKERLAQAKSWLRRLSPPTSPEEETTKTSWKSELDRMIAEVGYAHARAAFLTEGSPTFWIRRLEAMNVVAPDVPSGALDIVGENLSTNPPLVPEPPSLSITSSDKRLVAALSLGAAQGGGQTNDLELALRGYSVDAFAEQLKAADSLKGGTMDISVTGAIGSEANDLLAEVAFDGAQARVSGNDLSLDGLSVPIEIKGALDRPAIKIDQDLLKNLALKAGKGKVLDKILEETGGKDSPLSKIGLDKVDWKNLGKKKKKAEEEKPAAD